MRTQLCILALAATSLISAASYAVDQPATAPAATCNKELGRRLFSQCAICHAIGDSGTTTAGPNLRGVVGRRAATVPGFPYSSALQNFGKRWTREELNAFLEQPAAHVPGTAMAFAGLKKAEQRAAVICYIEQAGQ